MYYKLINNDIVCISNDAKTIIQTLPNKEFFVSDDSLPWVYTDKNILRFKDCSKFVFEEDYIEPKKTLDQLKQEKLDELESRFTERVKGSFITDEGYKMQFNESDCNKLNGAIVLMENLNNTTGYLTDADDNTHYDIPLATMKSVQNQMLNKYAQCHLLKQQYRALIEAADDEEALADIEFQFD